MYWILVLLLCSSVFATEIHTYELDEGSGTVAIDDQGSKNMSHGATYVSDRSTGTGLFFATGSGDEMSFTNAHTDLWTENTDHSVSAWFNFTSSSFSASSAFYGGEAGGETGISMDHDTTNLRCFVGDGTNYGVTYAVASLPTGTYVNIVCTYDKASTTLKLYVNGTNVANQTSATGWTWYAGTPSWCVGGDNAGAGPGCTTTPSTMNIDEIRLFDHELNQSEIDDIVSGGTPPAPAVNETEFIEDVVKFEQIGSLSSGSTSFQDLITGSYNLSMAANATTGFTVNAVANAATSTECRVLVNGIDYNTSTTRSLSPSDYGSIYFTSTAYQSVAGENNVSLQCRKASGVGAVTYENGLGIIHIQKDKNTNESINFQSLSYNYTISSSSYTKLGELSFITTNNNISESIRKVLVLNGHSVYNYDGTGTITTYIEINGTEFSEYPRYGSAGSTGVIGGLFSQVLPNVNESQNITINIYGKSTTSNGSISGNILLKEFIFHTEEQNSVTLNNTNFDSATYVDLVSMQVNNTNHASAELVVKAGIPYISNGGAGQTDFRLKVGSSEGAEIFRDVGASNQAGVSIVQDTFTVALGGHTVTLQGQTDVNVTIIGGDLTAYIADAEPFVPAVFNVTVFNVYNGSQILNFTVTDSAGNIFQSNTGTGIATIPGNGLKNLTLASEGFYDKTVTNHNTSTNLNTTLEPLYYFEGVTYSDFVSSAGVNYTRTLSFLLEAACVSGEAAHFDLYVNGTLENTYSATCNGNLVNNAGNYTYDTEGNFNVYFTFNATNTSEGNTNFTWDLNNPVINQSFEASRGFNNQTVGIDVACYDSISPLLNYTILWNGNTLNNSQHNNNTLLSFTEMPVQGENSLYTTCVDLVGGSTNENLTADIYNVNFTLINERTGAAFDVGNLSSVIVYVDDNSSSYDLQAAGSGNFSFTTNDEEKLRFEYVYADGFILNRYVDMSLVPDEDLAVCAVPDEGLAFFEQIIVSASDQTTVHLEALFADCTVLMDNLRFAYLESFAIRTFLIDTSYQLSQFSGGEFVFLASVDGGIESRINVDTLVFASTQVDLGFGSETVTFESLGNSTVIIYYRNSLFDNDEIEVTINRQDTGAELYNSDSFPNPNNFTLYFDFSTETNVTDDTLFKVTFEATKDDGSTSTTKRYFNRGAGSGNFNPKVVAGFVFLLLLFGFSFVAASDAFSWFGIFLCIGILGLLATTIWTWYITLLGALTIILLIYIVIILNYQTNRVVAT